MGETDARIRREGNVTGRRVSMVAPEAPVRDAATVVLIRDPAGAMPRVLIGRRGQRAAFMPDRFVFPGGATDDSDALVPMATDLRPECARALSSDSPTLSPRALAAGAIRELWEETGLTLGIPAPWPDPPEPWSAFAALGLRPAAGGLRYVFRAITAPGHPRRFDARFFLANVDSIAGDPDDFSCASGELSALQWIPLSEVRRLPLPFITEVVLAQVRAALPSLEAPDPVPCLRDGDEERLFKRLGGRAL